MIGTMIDVAGVILLAYVIYMLVALGYSEVWGRARARYEEVRQLWRQDPEVARARSWAQRMVDRIAKWIAQ